MASGSDSADEEFFDAEDDVDSTPSRRSSSKKLIKNPAVSDEAVGKDSGGGGTACAAALADAEDDLQSHSTQRKPEEPPRPAQATDHRLINELALRDGSNTTAPPPSVIAAELEPLSPLPLLPPPVEVDREDQKKQGGEQGNSDVTTVAVTAAEGSIVSPEENCRPLVVGSAAMPEVVAHALEAADKKSEYDSDKAGAQGEQNDVEASAEGGSERGSSGAKPGADPPAGKEPVDPADSSTTAAATDRSARASQEPDIVASHKKPPPPRPQVPPPRVPAVHAQPQQQQQQQPQQQQPQQQQPQQQQLMPPPRPPPPQRPKKVEGQPSLEEVKRPTLLEVPQEPVSPSGLVSPNTAVENLAKELQSLDLASLTAGEKVIEAQEKDAGGADSRPAAKADRPRSNSGRDLTDEEILAMVIVKNLDTGEEIPLNQAEEKLPKGHNPLALHIMRRTKEFISSIGAAGSDDEEKCQPQGVEQDGKKLKQKTVQLKRFLGKSMKKAKVLAEEYGERAVSKVRSVRDEVLHGEQEDQSSDEEEGMPYTRPVKFRAAHGYKGPYDFDQIVMVQDLSQEHKGAVWTMKFSHCGRLLATAGQDNVVRIWVLKQAHEFFSNMRQKYNTEGRVSPSPSQDSLSSIKSETEIGSPDDAERSDSAAPFRRQPFCKYSGHTADLLDLSWSKNYFLLSSSMDKTVRLWHISRKECLCCFQHIDFVTAIAFHPRDDRYFLSGSLDGKLRLWNIPEKKVALWNEVDGATKLITAANFCQNGKFAVIGTYDGRCVFYETEHLKYFTQIHVRSSRGRNRVGRKITGIEPLPAENKILVTSNDSRIRLYDLRDLSLCIKYKGSLNNSSQIKASFSHNFQHMVSGSEDRYVYLWKTYHDVNRFSSVRRDRNDYWEGFKAHNAVVTSAIFSPHPALITGSDVPAVEEVVPSEGGEGSTETGTAGSARSEEHGEVLVTADFTGAIKVFHNRTRRTEPAVP
ncbi:WD repeat-containing protein 44 isoform X2 [Lampetra fluviatilis]